MTMVRARSTLVVFCSIATLFAGGIIVLSGCGDADIPSPRVSRPGTGVPAEPGAPSAPAEPAEETVPAPPTAASSPSARPLESAEAPMQEVTLVVESDPIVRDPPPARIVDRKLGASRPTFQTKSASQLANAIRACVGEGATRITEDMIIGRPGGFLTLDFKAGTDIIEVQRVLFDGLEGALRTGVRPDQLTFEYLTAIANVANVVGAHCNKGDTSTPALCDCSAGYSQAGQMMQRCLSAFNPQTADFAQVQLAFAAQCRQDKGVAVASMIASTAFAKQ
jgi:hypothetical protein